MINLTPSQKAPVCLLGLGVLLFYAVGLPAMAQNLGTLPQTNVAVLGQTGAQPEGAFLNFVNWIGNVIAPVGAGVAVLGALVAYSAGRSFARYDLVALGLLAVSGLTRLLEFWLQQGSAGIS